MGRTCHCPSRNSRTPHASCGYSASACAITLERIAGGMVTIASPVAQRARLEVAVAAVRKDRNDRPSLTLGGNLPRNAQSTDHGSARRPRAKQTFFREQAIRHLPALVGADRDLLIELFFAIDRGDDRRGHVLESFEAMERLGRFDPDDANVSPMFSEATAGAHHRSTGPYPADQMGHFTRRLLPDLLAGGQIVRPRIRLIGVLIGIEVAVWALLDELPHQPDCSI